MTPHFSDAELACRCGCGMLPKQDFMDKVEALRVAYGKPLAVTSAARCPNHNARVSATGRTGPHTTGRAIDLAVDRGNAYRLLRMALEAGFSGLGFQQKGAGRFLHLDDLPNAPGQPRPTVWSY
jgi:zinc D-Ala-D-Ala carboxypeptidase